VEDAFTLASQKFDKVIELVRADLGTIRTGKASPALVESLFAEVYGTQMKLVELATIAAPDPMSLVVTPFDVTNLAAIAKAIQEANLGLTATPEETHVRVVVPALSEERRQEYVKLAKTKVEGGKVMVRQIRHEAMEEVAKGETDEDTKVRLEKEIQKLVDQVVEKLDFLADEKEKELLAI
jgi:ribosome recycling factor